MISSGAAGTDPLKKPPCAATAAHARRGALILLLICWLAPCFGASAAQAPQAVAGAPAAEVIPPESGKIRWQGELSVYPGDYLYDYINGGAPQYLEYGFVEVASQELLYNGHTYIFDIYKMETALGAFGIFSSRRPTIAAPVGSFPYSSLTTYQGMVAYGPYLMDISAYESSDETPAQMAALARLAAAQAGPSLAADDLTTRFPFTRLPLEGRHPGTEKLARGPLGLRAALGSAASGAFFKAIEAVQVALAADEIRRQEREGQRPRRAAQPDGTPPPAEPRQAPWWVVAGYHPRSDDEGVLHPETVMAQLIRGETLEAPEPNYLMVAARETIADLSGVEEIEENKGWIWTHPEGNQGCILRRGTDLLFTTSRLDAKAFRTWAAHLVQP